MEWLSFTGIDLTSSGERDNYKAVVKDDDVRTGTGVAEVPIVKEDVVVIVWNWEWTWEIYSCDESTKPVDNGHIIYTENPISENQSFVQDGTECSYKCKDGYSGSDCSSAPAGSDVLLVHSDKNTIGFNPDDSFSDSSLNTSRWAKVVPTWSLEIDSENKLKLTVVGDGSSYYQTKISSKYQMSWDFDIQVDYDWTGVPATSSKSNYVWFIVSWYDTSWWGNYFNVRLRKSSGWIWTQATWRNNQTYDWVSLNSYNNAKKFRIVRDVSAKTITWYYGEEGSRTTIWTLTNAWIVDVKYIQLYSYSEQTTNTVVSKFDNFKVNSADIVFREFTDSATSKSISVWWDVKHLSDQKQIWNSSVYFDGIWDYLDVTDSDDFTFGDWNFTIDAWVYYQSGGDDYPRIFEHTTDNINRSLLQINEGKLDYRLQIAWTWKVQLLDTENIPTNQWVHVAVVRNWDDWILFKDWKVVATQNISITYPNYTSWFMIWGIDYLPRSFKGYIDEFRVRKGGSVWTEDFSDALPTSGH